MSRKTFLTAMVVCGAVFASTAAIADVFRHTITGEELKIMEISPEEGRDTPAVKKFIDTGVNPYNEVKACLPAGEEQYLTACSGCHGHVGEGKLGPGLNDSYWTYPKNKTDKGLFETIYGGAQGMMGPHTYLELDDALKMMAWIRHLYKDDPAEAEWLTEEQRKEFKPYEAAHGASGQPTEKQASADACKISGS